MDGAVALEVLRDEMGQMVRWQSRVLDITSALSGAQGASIDGAISDALAGLAELMQADRSWMCCMMHGTAHLSHEWAAAGALPRAELPQDVPLAQLAAGEIVDNGGALLLVPITRAGQMSGYVGIEFGRGRQALNAFQLLLLKSVATAICAVGDRVAVEAGLRAERDRVQATLSVFPEQMLELDAAGRFVALNKGALKKPTPYFEALVGHLPEEVLTAASAGQLRGLLASLFVGGPPGEADFEMDVDGKRRTIYASAAIRSSGGVVAGYVLVIRDVTDRRRQQRELLLKGKIAELTSNLVVVTDENDCIEWVNPAFERKTGWTLDEVRGSRPAAYLQSTSTNRNVVRQMNEAIAMGKPFQGEIKYRSRSGEDYWVSSDIQPLIGRLGVIEGYVSVQADITALHRTHQRALKDRAMAMDVSMDGISITDKTGRFTYMNRAYRELFGVKPEEDVHNYVWQDFSSPDEAEAFAVKHWPELLAKGTWLGHKAGISRTGAVVQIEAAMTLRDHGGLLCIAHDVSNRLRANLEQTQLREQLQLAQRQETIAHVTSGVAHDLTNIVAVVAGTAGLLELQAASNPDILTGLARIRRATDIARDLVAGLGNLGRREVKRMSYDIRGLIEQGRDLLGTDRSEKFSIRVVVPPQEQAVWADPTELLQVLVNLALNACEAGPSQTNSVKIEVLPPDARRPSRLADVGAMAAGVQYCCFVISDTGSGVEPEQKQRMFDRYFTTKGSSGTGLGLPIVASIVSGNDAALWFDSVPGQGSAVTVAWPSTRPVAQKVTRLEQGRRSDIDLTGRNVLVVDDVVDVADILAEMIETSGAVAVAVSDSAEAYLLLSENPGVWSALITDFHMPGINGADLAQLAGRLEPRVATVLVTALPDKANEHAELFDMILSKPVDAERLIEAVKNAVSRGLPKEI